MLLLRTRIKGERAAALTRYVIERLAPDFPDDVELEVSVHGRGWSHLVIRRHRPDAQRIGLLDVSFDRRGLPTGDLINVTIFSGYGAIVPLARNLRTRLQALEAVETVLGCAFSTEREASGQVKVNVKTRATADGVAATFTLPHRGPTVHHLLVPYDLLW